MVLLLRAFLICSVPVFPFIAMLSYGMLQLSTYRNQSINFDLEFNFTTVDA